MQNPVPFQGDKAAIFDSSQIAERRFVPFEIKELSFKCAMGIMGVQVWDYMYHFGLLTEGLSMAFALHWAYHSMSIMTSTVRKIELH